MNKVDPSIEPDMRIPELLRDFPQTRGVLDRYGLQGCGGMHGPAESLRFFARAHEVDEAGLLTELRNAAAERIELTAPSTEGGPQVEDTIYRRFFLAGMAVVIIAGGAWGTWMLWKIGMARHFPGISIFEIDAHGHAQIFGWVGLFIMGFAYQAFPRFWRTRLALPRLAVGVFVAMLVGLITKTVGLAATGNSWAPLMALAGGLLEVAAIVAFVWQITRTFRRSPARLEPWVGFVFTALLFFVLQAIVSVWHAWMIMTASSGARLLWRVSTYQGPLRDLQIHGLALLMIVGVSLRMVPGLYDVPKVARRRAWAALPILVLGVLGEVILFIACRWTGGTIPAWSLVAPWSLIAVGVGMIVMPWRFWRPLRDIEGYADRSGKFIRAGYGWLGVSFIMLLLSPVQQHWSGMAFSPAYFGAARHAIAVGFISLMIMGYAAKVVPTLNGIDPRSLSQLWGPFVLVNLGCFWRVGLQTLTDSRPGMFPLVGISGVLELTALTWWAVGLVRVVQRGRRPGAEEVAPAASAPAVVAGRHRVADVLKWFPNSEPIFMRYGFSGICNPILRRTVARQVSLAQAAAMQGVELEPFLAALNRVAAEQNAIAACG